MISADDDATTGVEESFVWDLNGNRKNPGDVVPTANLLTTAGGIRYRYDDEGNLDEEQTASGNVLLRSFDWDYRQRLTKVTNYETGGQIDKTVEYVYDTFDRRVSSKVTDYTTNGSGVAVAGTPVVETYVFDEGAQSRGDVILDFVDWDGSGGNAAAVSKRYLWGQAVDQLFAQEDLAGQLLADTDRYAWLLQDKLGSVREVLDRSGALIARVEYNAFGEVESVTNAAGQPATLPTRYTFTAQEYDPITGNFWFSDGTGRGRWYSPVLQRFIHRDEPMLRDGPNPYAYVHNSPTNATDPSGQNYQDWFDRIPDPIRDRISDEQRQALEFGYYSAQLKLERDYLLARAQYLRKAIERFEPYRNSCSPGTRGGNLLRDMEAELAAIEQRFAENLSEATQLGELFAATGLATVEFDFQFIESNSYNFGYGLKGAQGMAQRLFIGGWAGRPQGLQPAMGPEEGLLAIYSGIKGLAALAGRSFTLGGVAATFSKGLSNNVRNFVRNFRSGADEAAEALANARKAGAGQLAVPKTEPCPGTTSALPGSKTATDLAQELGKAGEKAARIAKNSRRIESLTGKAKYRVPDELPETTLTEVKNVAYQDFSSQLQDSLYFAIMTGRQMILKVRPDTVLSKALQDVIRGGWIKLEFVQ